MKILVTGATGYIGSRLVPLLRGGGDDVRIAVRDPDRIDTASWEGQVEVVQADLTVDPLPQEMLAGIDVAYYLVHSMASGAGFHETDRRMALRFAEAARDAGVGRIVYLGALGDESTGLTEHLRSRQETGRLLASSGVDVVELRAGPVVGAGSLPFEMIRYLTERVPIMVCPRWVFTKVQPIGLADVLAYLVASKSVPASGHEVVEIGGSEVVSYGQMMTGYARVRGLRRAMIRVPVLTPRLSSLWVHLITPLRGSFARPIVEGLRNEVVVRDPRARELFAEISPLDYEQSVREALAHLNPERASAPFLNPRPGSIERRVSNRLGLIREHRVMNVQATPEAVYKAFSSLGGRRGWYLDWGWKLRGALDRLVGGPGLRRSHPERAVAVGDRIDFWTVEDVNPERSLRLRADMRLPGSAWLEFAATPNRHGGTQLRQTSYFAPKGLAGVLYWYALLPVHKIVFSGLVRRVASEASSEGAP